jgi:hypothetical protein
VLTASTKSDWPVVPRSCDEIRDANGREEECCRQASGTDDGPPNVGAGQTREEASFGWRRGPQDHFQLDPWLRDSVKAHTIRKTSPLRSALRAMETAAALGGRLLVIEADPFAESFYRSRGAVRVGEVPSEAVAGRKLPLMHFTIPEPAA